MSFFCLQTANARQIYTSKFFRKTTVTGGLYRYIRHPQYLALAIVGLGTTIYWPRFIVFIMYAVMLFLYYFLARQEERICLKKFGDSYQTYLNETGMFLPKIIEEKLPGFPVFFPQSGLKHLISISGLLVIYITIIIMVGYGVKNYALTKISTSYSEDQVMVSLAPLSEKQILQAMGLALTDKNVEAAVNAMEKKLMYVIPSGWNIPELGIRGEGQEGNYFTHPETHGNSLDFDSAKLTVLITKPILLSKEVKGLNILKQSVSYDPVLEVSIDVSKNKILMTEKRVNRGRWDGVPVPIY
jgi:hypothetical protein